MPLLPNSDVLESEAYREGERQALLQALADAGPRGLSEEEIADVLLHFAEDWLANH